MSDSEPDQALLEERARALAQPYRERTGQRRYTAFERRGVRYAIDPAWVFEVARVLAPTPLPLAERHWLGVTSLHGELLAVADLAVLLGGTPELRAAPPERSSDEDDWADERLVLVVGAERPELGIVIDVALETIALREDAAIVRAEALGSQLVLGTTEDGTQIVLGDALLADPRLTLQPTSQPRES